jgi:hypothetical protein
MTTEHIAEVISGGFHYNITLNNEIVGVYSLSPYVFKDKFWIKIVEDCGFCEWIKLPSAEIANLAFLRPSSNLVDFIYQNVVKAQQRITVTTGAKNYMMQKMFSKLGFRYLGKIANVNGFTMVCYGLSN